MQKKIEKRTSIFFLTFFSIVICAQSNYTLSGYIQDESSGENLIGVSIYEKESFKGTASNEYGFYSLTLPKGNYKIVYSFIGFKSIIKSVNLNQNLRLNVSLNNNAIVTEEIEVTGERQDKNVNSSSMSQAKIRGSKH